MFDPKTTFVKSLSRPSSPSIAALWTTLSFVCSLEEMTRNHLFDLTLPCNSFFPILEGKHAVKLVFTDKSGSFAYQE